MASSREQPNGDRNASSSRHPNTDNEEREDFNASGSGETASDPRPLNSNEDRALGGAICERDPVIIAKLRTKFGINSYYAKYIPILRNFEIVFVCDDSNSMTNMVGRTGNTRWQELCAIVKKLLPIAMEYDPNGVDVYFLNRESYVKVKNVTDVDYAFSETPRDYTPLVPVLEKLFHSLLALPDKEKKLLVFVATDGKPTDEDGKEEVDKLERLMQESRNSDTTYVSFLLCTDERECVEYMARWDREMVHVDVTDDYKTEREKILQCQEDPNYSFTYDDYIVKALVGSIIPHIDRLNEQKVTPAD